MHAPSGPHENPADHPVWNALSHYQIGPDDAALPFVARLARENGWTRAEAERVIDEYRRFCFLAVTCGHPVTPSDAVDQVWHLHLTYTRDYWDRFCPKVLGRPLHHGPTAGGADEQHRFFLQYADTLRSYERIFGSPPADLWPDARRRLKDDPKARRVHPRDAIIVPRRRARALVAVAVIILLALAAATILLGHG
ncbi:glycine-rich domain-containing protein [Sphingomonas sp. RS6]